MAPRSVASGVALNFGLISTAVSLTSALEGKVASGNVLVCDAGHEARQITQPRVCPDCGEVPFQQLKKARPVEGGLVVLDADDLTALSADAEQFKKRAAVTAHPAAQVEVLTTVGEKMYYLSPERGHETTYATLLALVTNHPELAFVTQWTPRSAASQFQLRAYNGALVFQERTRAGEIRPAPEFVLDENTDLIALAEQVLTMPSSVTDYDPQAYADRSAERLAEILKGKEIVPVGEVTTTATVPVADLMARLRAQVASEKKPAAKRRTTRKAVA